MLGSQRSVAAAYISVECFTASVMAFNGQFERVGKLNILFKNISKFILFNTLNSIKVEFYCHKIDLSPLYQVQQQQQQQQQHFKTERDLVVGHDVPRIALPHLEPYSSPRDPRETCQSSAGSCGTPDPRTPVTPRPASQQER